MFDLELPSGTSINIKAPNFMDRMNAVKEWRSVQKDVGYILEELMAANALVSVNGVPVSDDWSQDPIMRMADWSNVDVNFYIEFFMSAFFPDDKMKERAQEEAKKLMNVKSPTQKKGLKVTTG